MDVEMENTSGNDGQPQPQPEEKSFTTKQVEYIVKERLDRDRKTRQAVTEQKARQDIFEKYGLSSEDDLAEVISFKEKMSKKSAVNWEEKYSADSKKWAEKEKAYADEINNHKVHRQNYEIESTITKAASGKVNDIESFMPYVRQFFDHDGEKVIIKKNGEIIDEDPSKFMDQILAEKKHFAPPTGTPGAGSRVSEPGTHEIKSYEELRAQHGDKHPTVMAIKKKLLSDRFGK